MEKKCADERWAIVDCTDNSAELSVELCEAEGENDDDDEEALSLSDLPLMHQSRNETEKEEEEEEEEGSPLIRKETQDDFDFCSFSKESEMCAADEVFFQGQIIPLRHSISFEKGSLQYPGRPISWSESMNRCYSGRLISSRSSSISSHQSSSSGSSSATTASHSRRPKPPPRNQFHSHPSPSPRLHSSSYKQAISSSNQRISIKKSSIWSILRLGLVTSPPEMAFQDLKTRSTNCKNFGSRNSNSSNNSNKKKARAFLGGCNCSADAVDTVASRVVIIRRSASDGGVEAAIHLSRDDVEETKVKPKPKKQLSHHRTFEWLKQLSVEGAADEA